MTKIRPDSKMPMRFAGSSGRRESLNHSTSIGAPNSFTSSPARWRTREWRPSAPTAKSAGAPPPPPPPSALGGLDFHAHDPARLLDEAHRLSAHPEMKRRIACRLAGEEVEEIPLRHQRDEFAMGRQVCEVGQGHDLLPHLPPELPDLLVRQGQQLVDHAQLVHHLERGRVDR